MTTRRERAVLLQRTDLRALADELLGPASGLGPDARWPCPACDATARRASAHRSVAPDRQREPDAREPAVRESAVREPAVRESAVSEPAVREPADREPPVGEQEPGGSGVSGPATLRIVAGSPERWRCDCCLDAGTVIDLAALVRSRRPPVPSVTSVSTGAAQPITSTHGDERPRRGAVTVSLRTADAVTEVVVEATPSATVGQLASVWGRSVELAVDGMRHPASTPLGRTSFGPGSELAVGPAHERAASDPWTADTAEPAVALLRWVGGLSVGTEHALSVGRHVLGAAPDADLRVAHGDRFQAEIEAFGDGSIAVRSLGTAEAVGSGGERRGAAHASIGGWLSIGRDLARLEAVPAPDVDRATACGRRPMTAFNRPPRPSPAPPAAPIDAPVVAVSRPAMARFGGASVVVSLVGGLVVAVLFRQPLLLLMAGIGALGVAATAWQQRRRARREQRFTAREAAADLERFEAEVVAAHREATASRHRTPGPADAVLTAHGADVRLWERRPGHGDAFRLVLGYGDEPWRPALVGSSPISGAAQLALARCGVLAAVPRVIELEPRAAGGAAPEIVGLVGPRSVTRAVARSLITQASVFHGPADLVVAVAAADDVVPRRPTRSRAAAVEPWQWLRWLPHAVAADGDGPLVTVGEREAEQLALRLPHRPLLLVVDGPAVASGCNAGARPLLTGRHGAVSAVVLADRLEDLPSICTTIVEARPDGAATWWRPVDAAPAQPIELLGMSIEVAERVARDLARVRDLELVDVDAGLPDEVTLTELLGGEPVTAESVLVAWSALGADPAPRAPVAMAADGPVVLDLDRDGPHALVAGTTGSGKSELLRTFVAAFAARHRPEHLTFVLIDYKGGSAFDACAGLPHVVGLVTDLDDSLAQRALESLEAELHHRERLLRDAGAADLAAYRARTAEPLPRLVVVVDEFATLAAELPAFLSALVGVAQRGRSLGIHLVLATQRPSGSVSDDIRANTNLRLALRLHDAADSIDVLGDACASTLHRRHPGRAFLRLGPDELVAIQAARVTGPRRTERSAVVVHERVGDGWVRLDQPTTANTPNTPNTPAAPPSPRAGECGTELEAIVTAVQEAHRRAGGVAPRRPWLDPLPTELRLDSLEAGMVALVDEPRRQRQTQIGWRPQDGNLLLVGAVGSGTTTALASIVIALDAVEAADRTHVYVLDFGSGDLAPLAGLSIVGAVVVAGERDRQLRLVRMVAAELERRRGALDERWPDLVVVIDGLPALRAAWDEPASYEQLEALERVVVDGPEVSIRVVATADRPGALPMAMTAAMADQWLFRLADRTEAAAVGVPIALVPHAPGRAVQVASLRSLQVARPPGDVAALATARSVERRVVAGGPSPIGTMPEVVRAEVLGPPVGDADRLLLPIGIGDRDLSPVVLGVHRGDHVLVAGPARSGRTTTLALIAGQLRSADPRIHLVAITLRRSPLAQLAAFDVVVTDRERVGPSARELPVNRRIAVIIDDADAIDDADGTFAELARREDVCLVAAGRPDGLRSYGHWTQLVRRSRLGLLLRPQPELDGDLLGVVLPRRRAVAPLPGRGYLVADGAAELVQIALAGRAARPSHEPRR